MTLSRDEVLMENARDKMVTTARRLRNVLAALATCAAVTCACVLVNACSGVGLPSPESNTFLPRLCSLAVLGIAFSTLVLASLGILSGNSSARAPFSAIRSRKLFSLGVVFTVEAVVEASISAAFVFACNIHGPAGFPSVGNELAALHVGVSLIVAAIVSFYLSHLLEYGSFLQWLCDETF